MKNECPKSFARGALLAALSAVFLSAVSLRPPAEPLTPYTKVRLLSDPAASISRIPGIGPATASNIVRFREEHEITSIKDLAGVPGMGPQRLASASDFMELD